MIRRSSINFIAGVIVLAFSWLVEARSVELSNQVTLFQHHNYGGYSVVLAPGDYTLAQLRSMGMRNDDISSLYVPEGYIVNLYEHDHFKGWELELTSDSAYVGDAYNDKVSSIKVRFECPQRHHEAQHHHGHYDGGPAMSGEEYTAIRNIAFHGKPIKRYGWPVKVTGFDEALRKAEELGATAFHVYLGGDEAAGDMYPFSNSAGYRKLKPFRNSLGVIMERE